MNFGSIPIVAALKDRMQYQMYNQRVIADNVANADTPDYTAKILEKQQFSSTIDRLAETDTRSPRVSRTQMIVSNARHLRGADGAAGARVEDNDNAEVNPDGNSVVLEEEMIKLANAQMAHGMVAGIYRKQKMMMQQAMMSQV